ncbi:hypothetical protein BCV71DRAFT_180578, partial [Rhizopus microsporus]
NFFHKDGNIGIVNVSGEEAAAFVVNPSFRLTNLTNLHKIHQKYKVAVEIEEPKDADMKETPTKKERI